jgi:phosphopantothenate synthetase
MGEWYMVPVDLKATVFVPLHAKDKEEAVVQAERIVAGFNVGYTSFGPSVAQARKAIEYPAGEEAKEAAREAAREEAA